MEETWQLVPFNASYEVSNCGRVRRCCDCPKTGRKAGELLSPYTTHNGRLIFTLAKEGGRERWQAHRLVMRVFGPPAPSKRHIVAHNDGDHTHNFIGNLRWATYKENTADRVAHGTDIRGSQQWKARLTEADVADILATPRYRGFVQDTARRYGVDRTTIGKILSGDNWAHVHAAHAVSLARTRARR